MCLFMKMGIAVGSHVNICFEIIYNDFMVNSGAAFGKYSGGTVTDLLIIVYERFRRFYSSLLFLSVIVSVIDTTSVSRL